MVKYLLSCDGGGCRGIITLQLIKHIEENFNIKFHEYFDLFAGTSTGALIASLFAYKKMSAKDILEKVYNIENLRTIMYQTYYDKIFGMCQFRPKYTNEGKFNIINKYITDITSDILSNDHHTLYSVKNKHILITAYDPADKCPIFFRNYFDSPDFKINEVCNATSAAPIYFPIGKVTNLNDNTVKYLVDGGICANNPSNIAYIDAKKLYPNEKLSILSLGTGMAKSVFDPIKDANIGGINWLLQENIIDTILDGNQIMSHLNTEELASENNDKYLRINKYLTIASNKIDDTSDINYNNLLKEGTLWWEKTKNDLAVFFDKPYKNAT